jgi:hypothetical protein
MSAPSHCATWKYSGTGLERSTVAWCSSSIAPGGIVGGVGSAMSTIIR